MSSFYTLPIEFLLDEPQTIISFITSTRSFFNCSIIPIILSETQKKFEYKTLWEKLAENDTKDLKWHLLFYLSDTAQFSSRMSIPNETNFTLFCQRILSPLIRDTRYFTRTLKYFTLPVESKMNGVASLVIAFLSFIPSLESVSISSSISDYATLSQLATMPLRKLDVTFENPKTNKYFLREFCSSISDPSSPLSLSILKNTLEEFSCNNILTFNFLTQFLNLRKFSCYCSHFFTEDDENYEIDISPLGSLRKLQSLSLSFRGNQLTIFESTSSYRSVEECLSQLTELRTLRYECSQGSCSFCFLNAMPHLEELDVRLDYDRIEQLYEDGELEKEMSYVGGLSQLRRLDIMSWRLSTASSSACDIIFEAIGRGLVNLEELQMMDATLSPRGISSLHQLGPTLRKLNNVENKFVDGANFFQLVSKLVNLEELDCESQDCSCRDDHVQSTTSTDGVVSKLKKLDFIDFRGTGISFLRWLSSLEHLEYLKLLPIEIQCRDEWVHGIAKSQVVMSYLIHLKKLKHLDLPEIGDWKTKEQCLLKEAAFVDLEALLLSHCDECDNDTLELFSVKFPLLRELYICSSQITAIGVAKYLPKLKYLERLRLPQFDELDSSEKKILESWFPKGVLWYS